MGKDIEGGDHERKGTVWTATAHIVSAVIGSGVLALAWSVAQFGWIAGPLVLLGFSGVTYYTSTLLADCYRYPDPVTGDIHHAYKDAVRSYLGPREVHLCASVQYVNLWGTLVGYTITAATSMIAVQRSNCFWRPAPPPATLTMVAFGFSKSSRRSFPSGEHSVAVVVAVATSATPSSDSASASPNGCRMVYAQPIFAQFEKRIASQWPEAKFIHTTYTIHLPLTKSGPLSFTLSKLVLRTIFILFTTLVAMLLPFFNAMLGLIGALGFWPLSVYFPVSMHLSQNKIQRGAPKWIWLQGLSLVCLLISVGASVGSVEDIISNLKNAAPFKLAY
ncbi:uncharacterized protein A4U43_C02F6100 [Asparagus officinalis]|uniref:Amino acid transporter transmembrane domain-containing protein n=1 Tax=Asparagus officinalis TaxID=4686 RepID=A0A5P1FGA5_ASPOF|nr:uncharacterized protein A4U43_C02F6100 [Asparagus officinalis]